MRRQRPSALRWFAGALVKLIAVGAVLAFGLAVAVFFWAFTALRPDLSPPDPSSVPTNVVSLLRLDLGSDASLRAARYLVENNPPLPQLRSALAEMLARTWIEYRWTEDEMLAEIALRAYFGEGLYGVHEAAHGYFGVPAESLTVPQAAALVASTWSPSGLSPWCHPDENTEHVRKLLEAIPGENVAASLEGLLVPAADACAGERPDDLGDPS